MQALWAHVDDLLNTLLNGDGVPLRYIVRFCNAAFGAGVALILVLGQAIGLEDWFQTFALQGVVDMAAFSALYVPHVVIIGAIVASTFRVGTPLKFVFFGWVTPLILFGFIKVPYLISQ